MSDAPRPVMAALALVGSVTVVTGPVSSTGRWALDSRVGTQVVRVAPDAPLDAPLEPGTESRRLQDAVEGLEGPARIALRPGHYYLTPVAFEETTCGNCEELRTRVSATRGLRVSGRGIELRGGDADSVVIHTNAGYGVLFEDCLDCGLRGVTVTDGRRDPDGRATDAAVVVRSSSVALRDCRLRDNVGDSATVADVVVGIMGVAGREGADLRVEGCEILRNSWDGIALYRDARALIRDNVIDGVDRASGARIGGGRGVGIGLTWNADAVVIGNLVRNYWKGIGVFVDARAEVRENIVEDVLTWGIAYWDAGKGHPVAYIEGNVIDGTGACGASITREDPSGPAPGYFVGNALVRTGGNPSYDSGEPYCEQTALARHAVPEGFLIDDNLFALNRESEDRPGRHDLSKEEFARRLEPLLNRLARRPALAGSRLMAEW